MCSKCDSVADKVDGKRRLCFRHYRLKQMRGCAKRRGLYVPSEQELSLSIDSLDCEKCPECGRKMSIHSSICGLALVMSLQHWSDGSFSIICYSCNSRHGTLGDKRLSQVSPDSKFCVTCKELKNISEFYKGLGFMGRDSRCKECERERGEKRYDPFRKRKKR